MTDQPQDVVCRVIAEKIYDNYEHFAWWFPEHMKEEVIGELVTAIHDHTVVPEMVRMLERMECRESDVVISGRIRQLLAKAKEE